jgi:hypothetical protein
VNGIDNDTSDNNDNPYTTTHNPHHFLCKSHILIVAVGVPHAPGCHAVAKQDALAMTMTMGLRLWAGYNSLAIMPLTVRRLARHALDWHRSWSMTPGIRPVVTRAYFAWHI